MFDATVVVVTHTDFVSKEHARTIALGPGEDGGHFLGAPLGYESRVVLPSALQRPLRANAQCVHDFADDGKTELVLDLALDKLGNEAQRPQAKVKRKLIGTMLAHENGRTAKLLNIENGWASRHFLGEQNVLRMVDDGDHPQQNCVGRDIKALQYPLPAYPCHTFSPLTFDSITFPLFSVADKNWSKVKFCDRINPLTRIA